VKVVVAIHQTTSQQPSVQGNVKKKEKQEKKRQRERKLTLFVHRASVFIVLTS
jgi:hypothetical protein